MADWQTFGNHDARSADDLLELRLRGIVDETDSAEILRRAAELHRIHHRVFLLIDTTQTRGITPTARRYIAEWLRAHPENDGVSVLFGASTTVRTLGSLLNSAVRILSGRPTRNHFVKSEEEARAMIAQLRQEFVASAPKK